MSVEMTSVSRLITAAAGQGRRLDQDASPDGDKAG